MAVAASGRLIVVITLAPPTADSVARFSECLYSRREEVGVPLLGVIVLASPRPALDRGGRAAILNLLADVSRLLGGCAVWIRRGSFVGAIQRSLVTGLMMMRRLPIETDVVASAQDAMGVLARADPALSHEVLDQWRASMLEFVDEHAPVG